MKLIPKIILTIIALAISAYVGLLSILMLSLVAGVVPFLAFLSALIIPGIALPLIWAWKHRKKIFKIWLICMLIYGLAIGIPYAIDRYEQSITVNTSPNINTHEYLPFDENSKIVKIDSEFKLSDPLPIVDGAAAVFPVYSAFVHATYPNTTELHNGVFEYHNTSYGYELLAEGETDIFFGAYPSKDQIAYAEECGNPFAYAPIGSEAFVFCVHKDNPITNLTTEQIKGIYSGKITNWKEVGGRDEKIVAYQRNEGSGSQSMLKRFMGDTPIMEAPSELVNDFMSGIIERVSDYRSTTASIGFSFRFYVEGIIKNPDIKMISIDGVAPTVENIKNGTYPIVTSLYAVTNANEENENVQKLIDWVLSEEGQRIIEETGYVGVK
jgi:phosphate transport system substrate-binding protein